MLNTVELLDLAKSRNGVTSDYRLAQLLSVKQPTMTGYRHGRTRPDFPVCMRLAALCGLDPHEVVLWVQVERSTCDADREIWESIAARLASASFAAAPLADWLPNVYA